MYRFRIDAICLGQVCCVHVRFDKEDGDIGGTISDDVANTDEVLRRSLHR